MASTSLAVVWVVTAAMAAGALCGTNPADVVRETVADLAAVEVARTEVV